MPSAPLVPDRLAGPDAGELLTLQRAAYVGEARAHHDVGLPALTQTLAELRVELADPSCLAWGVREQGRLLAAVRVRVAGAGAADLGRLAVVLDRQGQGLGSALLVAVERLLPPGIDVLRLFTGEHSTANLRLYERHGYRRTHRTRAGGYDLVHLSKALPAAG